MEYQTIEDLEEEEIDLRALGSLIVRNLWKAILAGILAAAVVLCLMPVKSSTTYTASTEMYVYVETEDGLSTNSEVTNTSVDLVMDTTVLNEALLQLDESVDLSTLSSSLSAKRVSSTSIVRLNVTAKSKTDATEWVEAVRDAAIAKIPKMMQKRVICGSGDSVTVTSNTSTNSSEVKRNTVIAGLGVMLLAIIALLCREIFSRQIKSVEEAEKITGLPVIGTILDDGKKSKFNRIQANDGSEDLSSKIFHEAYRSLRTNVLYSAKKNDWKSFLINSSLRVEDVY
jgi:capsular polysaccharide biosynthesis protein